MLKADLKVVGGKHDGTVIPLTSKKFLIGREQDCQVRPNSELVSRHHCAITLDDYSARVRDFGSTNGTFVNGERVQSQAVLNSGDRIGIGTLEFEVVIHKEAQVAAADPIPPQPISSQPVEPEAATPPQVTDLGTHPPANTDTVFEIVLPQEVQAGSETAIFSTDATVTVPQQPVPEPAASQQMVPDQAVPQQMVPQQAVPQQMVPQQMVPQQVAPQQVVPQQMAPQPMVPQQVAPQQMVPQQMVPAPVPVVPESFDAAAVGQDSAADIPIKLPPPESTGAAPKVEPTEKPAAAPGTDEEGNPSTHAADIIRQYRQRRG